MQYKIIREPFMLLEAIGMLHKYINQIKAPDTAKYRFPPADDAERHRREDTMQRMRQIQEIIDDVCADVDRNDPQMVRFFGQVECGCEYTCLAMLLTYSFCTLDRPGFRENVEEICEIWEDFQRRGCWIHGRSAMSLVFSDETESPGNLIRQVKALNYPGDFRMELCDALTSFRESIYQLAELIEPLSLRLEQVYRQKPQLFGELWAYWENITKATPPATLMQNLGTIEGDWEIGQYTYLAFSYMNTNLSILMLLNNSVWNRNRNILYFGSLVTPESTVMRKGVEWDGISALLKCLGDSKRLEILRRLTKERSYGLALAEEMGMDQGNVSRNLGMLYNCGMLRQEREIHRTYYQTDSEALHEFFVRVEKLIHS